MEDPRTEDQRQAVLRAAFEHLSASLIKSFIDQRRGPDRIPARRRWVLAHSTSPIAIVAAGRR